MNPILTIYIYKKCPYSINAINFCKEKKLKYKTIDMDKYGGKESVIKQLKETGYMNKNNSHNTAPIVFERKKFIGGFDGLVSNYYNK